MEMPSWDLGSGDAQTRSMTRSQRKLIDALLVIQNRLPSMSNYECQATFTILASLVLSQQHATSETGAPYFDGMSMTELLDWTPERLAKKPRRNDPSDDIDVELVLFNQKTLHTDEPLLLWNVELFPNVTRVDSIADVAGNLVIRLMVRPAGHGNSMPVSCVCGALTLMKFDTMERASKLAKQKKRRIIGKLVQCIIDYAQEDKMPHSLKRTLQETEWASELIRELSFESE